MEGIRRGCRRFRDDLHLCWRHVADWGRHIWDRLTSEPGYAEAVAALVVASAELLTRSSRVRRLAHDLARVLLAVIRTLVPQPDPGDGLWT
ncbi:hypothetical protein [Nocardioides taihuensis]|uniref:Uncharacterized protein n=1 Tax=Nocardioides taihuensis TaxID=1835606 RepID=A0ABW0BQ21_9ACTN